MNFAEFLSLSGRQCTRSWIAEVTDSIDCTHASIAFLGTSTGSTMIHTHPAIKEQEDHIYFQCAHGSGLARCRHLSSININHNSQGRPTLKEDAALLAWRPGMLRVPQASVAKAASPTMV